VPKLSVSSVVLHVTFFNWIISSKISYILSHMFITAIFAVTFVMSAVLICKWTLSHYDDDDDDDNSQCGCILGSMF